MTNAISLFISVFLSCMIFIFYTNIIMQPRKSYLIANFFIALGYIFIYAISQYQIPLLNVAVSVAVNFFIIYLCFRVNIKNAIFQTVVLTAIMMMSEGIAAMLIGMNIEVNGLENQSLSLGMKIVQGVLSKFLYFIGLTIAKFISKDKHEYESVGSFVGLMAVPIFTIMYIMGIMFVSKNISETQKMIFSVIAIFGVIANIIVCWIYDKTLIYQREIQRLQEQQYKNNMELMYYNMIEDKLEEAKIMRHDFKEHLNILENYIDSDNTGAKEYLKSIELESDAVSIINYANNTILNIIFSEKHKLCTQKGITLKIHASDINIEFMNDIDLVAIFSNLLNNAIESCEKSSKKIIYVNLYEMNNAFLVIKIDNSSDQQPREENGFYKTTKISDGEHGIGLKSVAKTIKRYGGDLRLEYKNEDKIFSAMIMIPLV